MNRTLVLADERVNALSRSSDAAMQGMHSSGKSASQVRHARPVASAASVGAGRRSALGYRGPDVHLSGAFEIAVDAVLLDRCLDLRRDSPDHSEQISWQDRQTAEAVVTTVGQGCRAAATVVSGHGPCELAAPPSSRELREQDQPP